MPVSYIALSVSFVFLFLLLDAYFSKQYDKVATFGLISMLANLVSMFTFFIVSEAPKVSAADTHRGGNGVVEEETVSSHRVGNGFDATMVQMQSDLDESVEIADRILVDLAEIKAMLIPLDAQSLSDLDAGVDAGAGVSATPK